MTRSRKFQVICITLGFLTFIALQILARHPAFVEQYYSRTIYAGITHVVSSFSDLFPFSITEVFMISISLIFIYWFTKTMSSVARKRLTFASFLKSFLLWLVTVFAMFYIIFNLSWGINYLRLPLEKKMGLATDKEIDSEIFNVVLKELIQTTNNLYLKDRDTIINEINKTSEESIDSIVFGIEKIRFSTTHRAKTPIFNFVFNKLNINGVTSPFFQEIYYNADLIDCEIPFSIAHEKAHLRGYNSEADANFIAYLTCINSSNQLCRYSGNFSMLGYFLRQIKSKQAFDNTWQTISNGVKEDFKRVRERILRNRGIISSIHTRANDAYLKLNKVEGGVEDYSRVVKLVVGYERIHPSNPE